MLLVLVDPALSLLRLDHELVVAESGVDEGVDKGTSEVLTSRVDIGGSTRSCEEGEKGQLGAG